MEKAYTSPRMIEQYKAYDFADMTGLEIRKARYIIAEIIESLDRMAIAIKNNDYTEAQCIAEASAERMNIEALIVEDILSRAGESIDTFKQKLNNAAEG